MPTNHTTNYNLNQWVKSDQVKMEDFNDDNAKIDAALKAHDTSLASKATTSALSSLQSVVSGKASQSALNSLSATVSGHTTELSQKGNCILYTTSYTGSGEGSKTLTFSKPPQVVIVGGGNGLLVLVRGVGYAPSLLYSSYLTSVSWSGNSVTWSHGGSGGAGGAMNGSGSTYYVAALLKAD